MYIVCNKDKAVGEGQREVWMGGGRGSARGWGGGAGWGSDCGCMWVPQWMALTHSSGCGGMVYAAALCMCLCMIDSPPNLLLATAPQQGQLTTAIVQAGDIQQLPAIDCPTRPLGITQCLHIYCSKRRTLIMWSCDKSCDTPSYSSVVC